MTAPPLTNSHPCINIHTWKHYQPGKGSQFHLITVESATVVSGLVQGIVNKGNYKSIAVHDIPEDPKDAAEIVSNAVDDPERSFLKAS